MPPPKQYGAGLGRLLTTEAERTQLDQQRFGRMPEKKPEALPPPPPPVPERWHIEGASQRPGQRVTVWIDGRAYQENELPVGLSLRRNAKGEVIGVQSYRGKGKSEQALIGEYITEPLSPEAERAQIEAEKNKVILTDKASGTASKGVKP